jgi:Type I phosphodiesterase / nucleotide pyrophosphatase
MRRAPVSLVAGALVVVTASVLIFVATRSDDPVRKDDPVAVSKKAFLETSCSIPPEWARRIARGFVRGGPRDDDLIIVPAPPGYVGGFESTSHSGPYGFLQDVPLVFHGPGFVKPAGTSSLGAETTLADLAPTYAEMMNFDFPKRQGIPLTDILVDTEDTPNLIVTAVIDGGGWNVLEKWPRAWPFMKELIDRGASVSNTSVGSSPSVTPSIHTNLSTGAFPDRHGVTGIVVRQNDGSFVGGFSEELDYAGSRTDPSVTLKMTTLSDLWDKAMDNAPEIATVSFGNYTAGMIGHGADLPGGDKDIAAFEEDKLWATDTRHYSLPLYLNTEVPGPETFLEETDLLDGQSDDRWRGHPIAPFDATPAFAAFENEAIKAIIKREGMGADELTDLFYINYKAPDMAGHQWNMIRPEQKDVIRSVDNALRDLVSFLDSQVGADEYVLAITADHGQIPLEAGGWAVDKAEILDDVSTAFDHSDNGVGLIERTSPTVMFVNARELNTNDVTPEELASYLAEYTIEENVGKRDDETLRREFRDRADDLVFSAVYPASSIPEILECTGAAS